MISKEQNLNGIFSCKVHWTKTAQRIILFLNSRVAQDVEKNLILLFPPLLYQENDHRDHNNNNSCIYLFFPYYLPATITLKPVAAKTP